VVGWERKGFWFPDQAGDPVGSGLLDGPFSWPLLVARQSALRHNISTMAGYLAGRGVRHAPHGKTSMAPTLFAEQLAAGAWGLTAATANHILVYRRSGVPRILLANELLDRRPLSWLATELGNDPDFTLLSYVDSAEGLAALVATAGVRPWRILLELGYPGGRTGLRDVAELVSLARAAAGTGRVEVAGVAGYEGGLGDAAGVRGFLGTLRDAAYAVADLVPDGPPVASAGGSRYLDLVADELAGRDLDVIIRAGAYVSHDHGVYARNTPMRGAHALRPALELWAQVLSTPEPGLAIIGMGRRDAPYDEGLPVPLGRPDGSPVTGTVTALNDQHGYLASDDPLRPGDVLRFGISHPCSAFDRWSVIPVVDDHDQVTDLIRTYF
jgi:D-serine deaminase-like pyridoxal phosphate-dependent protein